MNKLLPAVFVLAVALIFFSGSANAVCICEGGVQSASCKACGTASSSSTISYTVKPGQQLSEIAGECGVDVETIKQANSLGENPVLQGGQVLQVPGGTCAPAGQPPSAVGTGQFVWPAKGPVTSPFGPRRRPTAGASSNHKGIDIGAPMGAPVYAADSGSVVFTGVNDGFGNQVRIRHSATLETWYNHLSAFKVPKGAQVAKGQVIAAVGSTGVSTGPHLHFEVRENGVPVDPMKYLR